MKKNILISSYNLHYGGIEKSLITLLKNFDYDKYNVTLFLEKKEGVYLNDIPKYVILKEYKVSNNKIKLIRKIINFIRQKLFILKYKNKFDASICFATYSLPCNFITLNSSKNSIFYIHSNYTYIYQQSELKDFFDKRHINKFKSIIFVSNEARNDLLKFYPEIKSKSYVINNLLDCNDIISKSKEKINEDYFKAKNIIFIGRLEESSKKVSRILEVAQILKDINFIIIGDGPDKLMYTRKIKEYSLSNICLLGSLKNPYPYLKKSDYLILTSDYEGFPVVYNEAIVLQKPIITTLDISDDYISISNRFGVVTSKDIASIVSAINNAYKNNLKITETVNFDKLNKNRMKKLEQIMEESSE